MSMVPNPDKKTGCEPSCSTTADELGDNLNTIEAKLTQARTVLLSPSAYKDALRGRLKKDSEAVRLLSLVLDSSERILAEVKMKHQLTANFHQSIQPKR